MSIVVTQPMHSGQPGVGGQSLVYAKLLNVATIRWNQRPAPDLLSYAIKQFTLGIGSYWDLSAFSSLGPGGLEADVISLISKPRLELDRLLPAQAEGLLQLQAHTDVLIRYLFQVRHVQCLRFRSVGHKLPVGNAVMVVRARHHILLVHFLCPPAQYRHPVLDRSGGELLLQPLLDQRIDMLRFQGTGVHPVESQRMQLIRDLHQMMRPLALGAVAAIPVLTAELFELVVQVSQGAISVWVTVGMPVTRHPPYRSVRALLTHTAPTSSVWRETAVQGKDEQCVL